MSTSEQGRTEAKTSAEKGAVFKSDTDQVEEASDVVTVTVTIPTPPPPFLQFPSVTVEEPATAVDVDAPQPSPPVKAAEEAAAIKVVVEHTSDGAHAAEQAPVSLLPTHVPAERPGHLHPSQHLLPLQSVDNIFKSYCFLDLSLQPFFLPSCHRQEE